MAEASSVLPNKGLLWTIKWLLILTVCTLLVDLYFTATVWSPNGLDKMQELLDYDLARAGDHASLIGDGQKSGHFAAATANKLYEWVFVDSGLHDMGVQFASPEAVNAPGTTLRNLWITWDLQIRTAMLGLQLFGVRLGVLLLSLPLFLVAIVIAMSDGWAARYIRTACGGRESSFLYHHCKHAMFLTFIAMWGVYLCLPLSMDPKWVLPPFAVTFGVAMRFMFAWFKKYV